MNTYQVYYLVSFHGIEAGPFRTIDAAVLGKDTFTPPYRQLLSVVKSTIETQPL